MPPGHAAQATYKQSAVSNPVMTVLAIVLLAAAAGAFGEVGVPHFRAEDVRPHGSADPYPLTPGIVAWIFGEYLSGPSGCSADNLMDPATYKTELCGTRVEVGGIAARLIAVLPGQINLVLPDHPWENEMVGFRIIRDGRASATVPVYFGFNQPVVSLDGPVFAGMPVWVRVQKPWGKGWLRYPFRTEPWDMGPGSFEVRFEGRELPMLPVLPRFPPIGWGGGMMGLPGEVPGKYRHRLPLHLLYPLDRPGIYEIRYTEYRSQPGSGARTPYQRSDWTAIELLPSTPEQRRAWFEALAASPPGDTVGLLADFLPSLLARRDEAALRVLARYLDSPDKRIRQYAAYASTYFDAGLRRKVVPGREPLRGGVG